MFHEMGRLHYATVQSLDGHEPERTVYGEMRALAGDRPRKEVDSAISNASYASRVYCALVVPGRMTEDEFNALTFADCLAAVRAANLPPVTRRRHKLRRRPRQ